MKVYLNTCECGAQIKVKFGKSKVTTAVCKTCGNKYSYSIIKNGEEKRVHRSVVSIGINNE